MRNRGKITVPNVVLFEHVLEFLKADKSVIIAVKGRSMRPFLNEGERVVLHRFRKEELRKGSIVLAKEGQAMLLHRVVKITDKKICLAGDGNLVQHEQVNLNDVLAIATHVQRDKKDSMLNSSWSRIVGLFWYWIRPLRRVVKKIM